MIFLFERENGDDLQKELFLRPEIVQVRNNKV